MCTRVVHEGSFVVGLLDLVLGGALAYTEHLVSSLSSCSSSAPAGTPSAAACVLNTYKNQRQRERGNWVLCGWNGHPSIGCHLREDQGILSRNPASSSQ